MSELSYKDEAASSYDRAFAHVSAHFLPFLLRAAHLEPGQRVLDGATGTGLAAEAALVVVGPGGHVTAADISQAMVDRARQRFAGSPNTSVVVTEGNRSVSTMAASTPCCAASASCSSRIQRVASRSSIASCARADARRSRSAPRPSVRTTAGST